MLTAPSGTPDFSMISATVSIVSGSLDGGLRTIELPAAMAGATLCAARLSGKLNGLMPAMGPIGKRLVIPTRPLELAIRSSGMSSPADALSLLCTEAEGERGSINLDQRVADGLARLESHQPAQLLTSLSDAGTDVAQDRAALVRRQCSRHLEGAHGGLDGFLVLLRRRVVGRTGELARPSGIGHLEDLG